MEDDGLALTSQELFERRLAPAGLAQLAAVERGNLVGADDECAGCRDAACLGIREALRHALGRLAVDGALVGFGFDDVESDAEPLEQLAPIPGRGGE